jgi:hypothetical protein
MVDRSKDQTLAWGGYSNRDHRFYMGGEMGPTGLWYRETLWDKTTPGASAHGATCPPANGFNPAFPCRTGVTESDWWS